MGLITVYVVFLQSRECNNIDVRYLSHSGDVIFHKIWQTNVCNMFWYRYPYCFIHHCYWFETEVSVSSQVKVHAPSVPSPHIMFVKIREKPKTICVTICVVIWLDQQEITTTALSEHNRNKIQSANVFTWIWIRFWPNLSCTTHLYICKIYLSNTQTRWYFYLNLVLPCGVLKIDCKNSI